MTSQRSFRVGGNPNNPFGSIFSLLIFAGILILLFFLVTGFVKLLYLVAPVLLIATLLINYRIVADYARSILDTFKTDILFGIVKVLFNVFCYPFVIGWLFTKALFYRKIGKLKDEMQQQMGDINRNTGSTNNAQLAEYEELSSDINSDEQPMRPTIIELPKPKDKLRDDFDQYFK